MNETVFIALSALAVIVAAVALVLIAGAVLFPDDEGGEDDWS